MLFSYNAVSLQNIKITRNSHFEVTQNVKNINMFSKVIKNNIFSEFSGCSNTNTSLIDKTDIIKSLKDSMPNCKEVNFRVFGFSLATINFIISILISVISFKYFINEKNR